VPALQQRVLVGALDRRDLEDRPHFRCQRLVLREPEQPIEADGVTLRNAPQRFGARQAERGAGEKLRQR
jgi:hypothetical protein